MLNINLLLKFAFVLILSEIFIFPNPILIAVHADGRWPLEFVFVQILDRIFICPNLVLSAGYQCSRWPIESAFFLILILSAECGDSRWPIF